MRIWWSEGGVALMPSRPGSALWHWVFCATLCVHCVLCATLCIHYVLHCVGCRVHCALWHCVLFVYAVCLCSVTLCVSTVQCDCAVCSKCAVSTVHCDTLCVHCAVCSVQCDADRLIPYSSNTQCTELSGLSWEHCNILGENHCVGCISTALIFLKDTTHSI